MSSNGQLVIALPHFLLAVREGVCLHIVGYCSGSIADIYTVCVICMHTHTHID